MNPYLQQMGDAITGTATRNLTQNILPTMRRGAVASGGWGNSGQGIAQGMATEGTQRGITDSLAGLYGGAYEGDQNRSTQMGIASMQDATNRYGLGNQFTLGMGNLGQQRRQGDQSYLLGLGGLENQRTGMDQSFALGLGGLDNQRYGIDTNYNLGLGGLQNQAQGQQQNFYTQQRGQDLQAQQQAQNQYLAALQAQMGIGGAQANIGNQEYNAGLDPLQAFGSGLSPFTGLNSSSTQTSPQTGGGVAGAVGGAISAAQLAQLWQKLMGGG